MQGALHLADDPAVKTDTVKTAISEFKEGKVYRVADIRRQIPPGNATGDDRLRTFAPRYSYYLAKCCPHDARSRLRYPAAFKEEQRGAPYSAHSARSGGSRADFGG